MKSVTVPVLVDAIEKWADELAEAQASGQYEHTVAHTLAGMQTAVRVLRHMLDRQDQSPDD